MKKVLLKKLIEKRNAKIETALTTNLQYSCDIDYDTDSNCSSEGCDEEGICRCSTIRNTRLKSVDSTSLQDALAKLGSTPMQKYGVDRLLRHSDLNDPSNYDVGVSGGYYGEEIDGVWLNSHILDKTKKELIGFFDIENERARLFYCLEKEYGHILPSLKKVKKFRIKTISAKDINVGNKDHYRRLDIDLIESYTDYNLPRVLVIKEEDKYRLIDGYHRFAATKNSKILAIVGE